MIHAYDEIYLERARSVMAHMLDCAVYNLEYSLEDFFAHFLVSDLCAKFERGDASVIAGKSGVEIAYEVLNIDLSGDGTKEEYVIMHRSPEYWLGWALAYYQWYSGMRFSDIVEKISINDICSLYNPYHEMDIRQFADKMDEICHMRSMETRLKRYRTLVGISQKELAEKTNIPVRTIQQYEQRQKNINKAQVEYLMRLSKVLYCRPENLLEEDKSL